MVVKLEQIATSQELLVVPEVDPPLADNDRRNVSLRGAKRRGNLNVNANLSKTLYVFCFLLSFDFTKFL